MHLGVTSLRELGMKVSMSGVDAALRHIFESIFGKMVHEAR
jgi:hypothetical protein